VIYRKTVRVFDPAEVWNDLYFSDEYVLDFYECRRSGFAKIVSLVDHRVPSRGIWLDVGCGLGLLLDVAHRVGWSVCGIDPCPTCCESTRRRIKSARIVCGSAAEALSSFSGVALASAVDVLRFVDRPGETIAGAREALAEGGWILIREVNADVHRRARRQDSLDAGARLLEPVQEWTPSSLERTLRRAGFRNVKSVPSPVFVETTTNEHRRDSRVKQTVKTMAKLGYWPVARLTHHLSGGLLYLGPNFITMGQK
jgi:2-polyprenyl-3-methyl-5-hydroxy-6-metoxy-1,4-benzoquinol methylase